MVVENTSGVLNGGEEPKVILERCLRDGRIDILRSVLQELSKTSASTFPDLIDGKLDSFDGTLLHLAVSLDSVDGVRVLLSSGANPAVHNSSDFPAAALARSDAVKSAFIQDFLQSIAMSNLGRVCQLIAGGVSVHWVDSPTTQNTPLHYASSYATLDVVRTICESGANINSQNATQDTPLHEAVRRRSEDIVKLLLDHGADPLIVNAENESAYAIAEAKAPELISLFSLNTVARGLRRAQSVESVDFDRASLISTDTLPLITERFQLGKIESWTDLLWPQPHFIRIDRNDAVIRFPSDGRLKVYFDGCGDGEPRRIMQVVHTFVPYLASINLEIEYRGHRVTDSNLEGRIMCSVFSDGERPGAYTLDINADGFKLAANDYSGIRYGFSTLVQILRIFSVSNGNRKMSSASLNGSAPQPVSPNVSASSYDLLGSFVSPTDSPLSVIPCLSIRDSPDVSIRAVYQDFSGCKMLNLDTMLQLVDRLSYCKANYFFVNFECRTTDRYQLPYTNRDLFHMTQFCDEHFVKLVPSLDLQTNSVELETVRRFIDNFLDDFPLSRIAHFGPNITSILAQNFALLDSIQKRIPRIFLSVETVTATDASWINRLPSYVTLCVEGRWPFEVETLILPSVNLVIKFPTTDIGYLCASPETTAKNALLATQLTSRASVRGVMICENSNGCEIMPPSMSLMPECACIGAVWNSTIDMKRFAFLLPRIAAEHFLLDGHLVVLLEQAANLGRVEHELTKYSYGVGKFAGGGDTHSTALPGISVFVEIILNPENIQLKRLTPSIFKKARIELQRSARALRDARSAMRYEQYELALILAEIQLVTELMTLVTKIGQFLCFYGNPKSPNGTASANNNNNNSTATVMSPNGTSPVDTSSAFGFDNHLGVSKLPQATRTDLANSLLEIRRKFQHTWMSRNLAYTLPNALKMFDNLFRALLPPSMQEYEKIL